MTFDIILAKSNDDIIGLNNEIPWKISKDMKYFKKITTETKCDDKYNSVIMGYNTWKSLNIPFLPKRYNFVIDKNVKTVIHSAKHKLLYYVPDFETALDYSKKIKEQGTIENIFLIGGAKLYNENLEHKSLHYVYVTNIKNLKLKDGLKINKLNDKYKLISGVTDSEDKYKLEFLKYKYEPDYKHEEYQYYDVIRDILDNGESCDDRTNVGTYSVFGRQFKWDLSTHFPLLTTKRMYFKGIVEELLWFLRGETDNKLLNERKVRIWDGNSSREFLDNQGLTHLREGDIGKSYGFQFRHFGGDYTDCETDYSGIGYDQFMNVIKMIKENPNSRRIIISLWNPVDLKEMALPPCLFYYQFRVYGNKLNLHILNRSNDMALGHPWNIATGALMCYIVSHMTGLIPGELTHSVSDAHIYKNHLDAIKEHFNRTPRPFPILKIKDNNQKDISDYKYEDFEVIGYNPYANIKMDMVV